MISVIMSLGHKQIKHLICCITQENGIDVLMIYSNLLSDLYCIMHAFTICDFYKCL